MGPERLRVALEELGGTFIKLGQMLALQPDILRSSYCDALYRLLDRVAPFSYPEVERTFREELGRTPEEGSTASSASRSPPPRSGRSTAPPWATACWRSRCGGPPSRRTSPATSG